jgi:ribosomal protein L12E/L44/L45/RPP1/RPP2
MAMSEQQHSGFGQFIPGFDFLQNLAKDGAQAMPQMPGLSNWIAPTLNVEELDKRIGELKAVRFWLEQNATAVGATIQALEVQKMTLATLQGMNVKMADLAESMKFKPDAPAAAAPAPAPAAKAAAKGTQTGGQDGPAQEEKVVDPLQWWGALTQQFQQIAATAMQEVAAGADSATKAAGPAPARTAAKAAPGKTKRPARKSSAS